MNLIGKTLTLLIFLMSFAFFFIAVTVTASHQNWKTQAEENKQTAERYNQQYQLIKSQTGDQLKTLEQERVMRYLQIQQLETQLATAKDNLVRKEDELNKLLQISQERLERMKQAEARLTEQDTQVAGLKTSNTTKTQQIAAEHARVVDLVNQKYALEGTVADLKKRREELESQAAKMSKVLMKNGLDENSLVDHIPPKVEGRVMGIDGFTIAINLGGDDGIKSGHNVDLFRQNRYIGSAEVTVVKANRSAARLNRAKLQDAVQEGDHVTTKF